MYRTDQYRCEHKYLLISNSVPESGGSKICCYRIAAGQPPWMMRIRQKILPLRWIPFLESLICNKTNCILTQSRLFLLALNPVYWLSGSGNWLLTLITKQLGNGFRSIFALVRPYVKINRFLYATKRKDSGFSSLLSILSLCLMPIWISRMSGSSNLFTRSESDTQFSLPQQRNGSFVSWNL